MANSGKAPFDPTTDVGRVRLLLSDTDPTDVNEGEQTGTYRFNSDVEIEALVTLYGGSVKRAAAQILRTVASQQVLLLKAFSSADLSVNGPAIAEALRLLAKDLDSQADTDGDGELNDYVAVVPTGGRDLTEIIASRSPSGSAYLTGRRPYLC